MNIILDWKVGMNRINNKIYILIMLGFVMVMLTPFKSWSNNTSNDLPSVGIENNYDTVTWLVLQNLEYLEKNHKEYGVVYLPKFDKSITKLANKTILIRGYLVPVDAQTWALSKNTYAACFFCGKAGPETVMGLTFKKDPGKLKMDTNVLLKGKLKINGTDVDDWMYSLVDVEILEKK